MLSRIAISPATTLKLFSQTSFRIQCRFKSQKEMDDEIRAKRDYIQQEMQKQRLKVQTKKVPVADRQDEFDKIIKEKFPELKKIEENIRDRRELLKEKRGWRAMLKFIFKNSHSSRIFYLGLVFCVVASMLITQKKAATKLLNEREVTEKAYQEQIRELEVLIEIKKRRLQKE